MHMLRLPVLGHCSAGQGQREDGKCTQSLSMLNAVLSYACVPWQVRDFQAVIGEEVRRQCQAAFGGKPDVLLACVGGGSNAIGLFHEVRRAGCHPKHAAHKVASDSLMSPSFGACVGATHQGLPEQLAHKCKQARQLRPAALRSL